MTTPIEIVAKLADLAGYQVIGFERDETGSIVRITGPMFPAATGLPFAVWEERKEVWADRWRGALGAAFLAGMAKANDLNEGKTSVAAIHFHELARAIVSEVRSPGPDDEKAVAVALMIRTAMGVK